MQISQYSGPFVETTKTIPISAPSSVSNMEMPLEALAILSNGILFLSYNKQFGGS